MLLGGAAAWTVVDHCSVPTRCQSQSRRPADALGCSRAARPRSFRRSKPLGYREGQNLVLEVRSADGRLDQLPALAEELIRAGVEVIVAVNSPGTQAAIASGTKIPIVMALVGDPVGTGFVPNLNRPGGTVTGVSNASGVTAAKRLELLKNAVPRHGASPYSRTQAIRSVQSRFADAEAAAGPLGVELKVFPVVESREAIERAVAAAIDWRAQAVSAFWPRPLRG